jgi:hypothetical protein
MKSRFALLAMVLVSAAPLAAQGGGGMGGGRGGNRMMNIDTLTATYSLSADQKTKAEGLIKIYNDGTAATMAWMRTQRQAQAEIPADSSKKVTDAMAKFNADFKALLAGPQIAKFDSIQAARAARMGGRGPGGGQ